MATSLEKEASLNAPISNFRTGQSTVTVLMGIRDPLIHAMKKKEVTLMVLADPSKAFDMVCFKTVIGKMHALGFSRISSTNSVSDGHHVLIDDLKTSSLPPPLSLVYPKDQV